MDEQKRAIRTAFDLGRAFQSGVDDTERVMEQCSEMIDNACRTMKTSRAVPGLDMELREELHYQSGWAEWFLHLEMMKENPPIEASEESIAIDFENLECEGERVKAWLVRELPKRFPHLKVA